MTDDPEKTPATGEPTPTSNAEFRQEASSFLGDKPEPGAHWEPPTTSDWQPTPPEPPKERRSIFFPVALILLGGLALAYNFDLIQVNFWYWLSRLWPVWLIIAGLDIVISRKKRWFGWIALGLVVTLVAGSIWGARSFWDTVNGTDVRIGAGSGEATPIDFPLEKETKEAEIRLSPGIAQLRVDGGSNESALAQGTIYSPPGLTARTNLDRQGERAILSISQRDSGGIRLGTFDAQPWELHLSPKIPLRLNIDGGVGRSDLDLRDLQVTSLSVKSGVGETAVTLPANGKLSAAIDAGVGRIIVRIPRSMGAQIKTSTGIGGVSVQGNFEQSGRTYRTPGYAQSANQADLDINGGIGSIEIELID